MEQTSAASAGGGEVEEAKRRCISLRDQALQALPPSKISNSSKQTLLRLLDSELRFLSRLAPNPSHPLSANVGYLESIARVIQHPSVRRVSRVCKPLHRSIPVHVDIVCTFGRSPAWFVVSDRNPKYLSWLGSGRDKGVRARVERVLAAGRSESGSGSSDALKPASVFLVFSRGTSDEVSTKLVDEFGAVEIDFFEEENVFENLEEGWVGIGCGKERARVFKIKVGSDSGEKFMVLEGLEEGEELEFGEDTFGRFISKMWPVGGKRAELVNLDTTALVALVSGISNGGAGRLLEAPEMEMRQRFKGNYEFVIAQVMSELEHPILEELKVVVAGKKGIICATVMREFSELVHTCGGHNERTRAARLMRCLLLVPDCPSARVAGLPTTRKIALKSKIVFGTGDYWHAPTLTANMGIVRAISQTGMSLLTIEHKPRALTGE